MSIAFISVTAEREKQFVTGNKTMALFGRKNLVAVNYPGAVEAGPAFDVRPASPERFASPYSAAQRSGLLAPFAFVKDMMQGACAGLLTLLGALHLTEGVDVDTAGLASIANFDIATFEMFTQKMLAGGAPGVVEIVGAAAIFLNAGKGWARIIGLMGFIAAAVAYTNGVDQTDFLQKTAELYDVVKQFIGEYQAAQTANAAS